MDRKAEEQNKFIERVDVLNKDKELFLMPTMVMMSTQMVSEFYEVPVTTINNLYERKKEEIDTDGVKSMKRNEIKEMYLSQNEKGTNKVHIHTLQA